MCWTCAWCCVVSLVDALTHENGRYGDENISDGTVQLLESLALLRWLNVQRVKKLTDASLVRLQEGCASLRVLVLGFNKVTDDSVESFQQARPNVRLYLDGYKRHHHSHEEADVV